jgi:hypothetical protein
MDPRRLCARGVCTKYLHDSLFIWQILESCTSFFPVFFLIQLPTVFCWLLHLISKDMAAPNHYLLVFRLLKKGMETVVLWRYMGNLILLGEQK